MRCLQLLMFILGLPVVHKVTLRNSTNANKGKGILSQNVLNQFGGFTRSFSGGPPVTPALTAVLVTL